MSYLKHAKRAIVIWSESKPFIKRAWLFGSRATGLAEVDSDIDVAIELIESELNGETDYSFWHHEQHDMIKELQTLLPYKLHLELYAPGMLISVAKFVDTQGVLLYTKDRATLSSQ